MRTRRHMLTVTAAATALVMTPLRMLLAMPRIPLRDGKAVDGYDCVAYQAEKKAAKGQTSFSFVWNDATFLFKSQQNRDAFSADPARYAPAFNGYCTV